MKKLNQKTYAVIAGYLFTSLLVTNLCRADEISASFYRDMDRTAVTAGTSPLTRENNLPVQNAVNLTVWTQETDQVSESFNRTLNHKSVATNKSGQRQVDPVAVLIRKNLLIQRTNEQSMKMVKNDNQ